MNKKSLAFSVLSVVTLLLLMLSGCVPVRAALRAETAAPEEVVQEFYNWYLSYPGNVMADGAHRSSEYLTQEFVQKVDAVVASFDQGGYDPFLCAQDVPGDVIVDEAVVSGDAASVVVHQVWNVGTEHEFEREVEVELHLIGGAWTISDIVCR